MRTRLRVVMLSLFSAAVVLAGASLAAAQDASTAGPSPNTTTISGCSTLSAAGTTYVLSISFSTNANPCFSVTADNVTLNLSGFTVTSSSTTNTAVSSSGHTNLIVENGTLNKFGVGIDTSGSGTTLTTLQNLVVENSTNEGANLGASGTNSESVVKNSIFDFNGGDGLDVGANSIITDSVSYDNGGNGFSVQCPSDVIFDLSHKNTVGDFNLIGTGCTQQ